MAYLGNPTNTIEIIKKYDFSIQKKYGQNFLVDSNVLEKIVSAAEITKEDFVLEIGPGIGSMTQYLAEAAGKVIAVEIDRALIPILTETLSEYDNIRVINDDILRLNLRKLIDEENKGKPIKVVANLPYYITTPIIMGLLEKHEFIDSITIMMQSEVADRMQAVPGTKDYGALSLAVQYYSKPQIMFTVSPSCFMPRPKVESTVIRLKCHRDNPLNVKDPELMFRIIRAVFNQRRKTMVNSIGNAAELPISREMAAEALKNLNLDEAVRGEKLSLEQFAQFSNQFEQ